LVRRVHGHSGGKAEDNNEGCDSPGSSLRFTMEANIFAVQVVFRSTQQRGSNVQERAPVILI
jgi:hypothetical protein